MRSTCLLMIRPIAALACLTLLGSAATAGDWLLGGSGHCDCDSGNFGTNFWGVCERCRPECDNSCKTCRADDYARSGWFNCGCNGSYKFPVPPLSTYHWPGLYSHQLMTDYHSPWRFSPLKPYMDEPRGTARGATALTGPASKVRPVSAAALLGRRSEPSGTVGRSGTVELMSEKMKRL